MLKERPDSETVSDSGKKVKLLLRKTLILDDDEFFLRNGCRTKCFLRIITSRDYCQRFLPLWINDTRWVGFKPVQHPSSGFVEWSCGVVITTKQQGLKSISFFNSWMYIFLKWLRLILHWWNFETNLGTKYRLNYDYTKIGSSICTHIIIRMFNRNSHSYL